MARAEAAGLEAEKAAAVQCFYIGDEPEQQWTARASALEAAEETDGGAELAASAGRPRWPMHGDVVDQVERVQPKRWADEEDDDKGEDALRLWITHAAGEALADYERESERVRARVQEHVIQSSEVIREAAAVASSELHERKRESEGDHVIKSSEVIQESAASSALCEEERERGRATM